MLPGLQKISKENFFGMYYGFDIGEKTEELARRAENDCRGRFEEIDENCMLCSARVLKAFQDCGVSTADFLEITGYGYDDPGRDKIERIYSQIFGTEDALVRVQMMSGTHALSLALGGLLKHGDILLSVSGEPYDTLRSVIGTEGSSRNSLAANGVKYEQIDLADNDFDLDSIRRRVSRGDVKLIEIQRSRGYSRRKSLTVEKIGRAIAAAKEADPGVTVLVDNCYGEFTEDREPSNVGADIIVGSMMKNPGGGIAVTGAYCAGRSDLINDVAERLTAPMIGKSLGANLNQLASFYKGLFMAPSAVRGALKTMVFSARLLELAGFSGLDPAWDEKRTDIVQTVDLESAENLVNFCVGLQHGSPIEAFATPEPGEMPGYPHDEVMACGAFTTGSTIELSADGPLCPPYTAFMQGGLTYEYGKLGVIAAVDSMLRGRV
jgi:cystathionine beta-lyase family protein involved in aluminum resistance